MSYQRHPLEITPLVFGLVFLGIVTAWGLFELEVIDRADAAWILPIVLIGAGALGVLLAATKPRRTREAEYEPAMPAVDPWPPQSHGAQASGRQTDTGYAEIGETEGGETEGGGSTDAVGDTASFDAGVSSTKEHPTQDSRHEEHEERHDD